MMRNNKLKFKMKVTHKYGGKTINKFKSIEDFLNFIHDNFFEIKKNEIPKGYDIYEILTNMIADKWKYLRFKRFIFVKNNYEKIYIVDENGFPKSLNFMIKK